MIKDIREQLLAIGWKIEKEDMVVFMLKSLSCAYEHFIETLNITYTYVDQKFNELWNNLFQQDRWKKYFGSINEVEGLEQGFVANVKGKGKWAKKKGQGSSEDATKSMKIITCHYCGKVGHMKSTAERG